MAKANAIGIDIGTTNTCAAIFHNGKVEILKNDYGNLLTPSYVAFSDTECLVGDSAKNRIASNPVNTVYGIHRFLCRKTSDPQIQSALNRIPFRVIPGENDFAKVKVHYKGEAKTLKPEEVLSILLRNIKENAEKVVGRNSVRDVVITIPASFNYQQRQAIKDAATQVGLNVLRLMPSTSAAALAYGFNKKMNREQNVMVFDLGGGTSNVSVVTIEDGLVDVKSYACGYVCGEDFVNRLINHFISEIRHTHGKDVALTPRAFCRLRSACESAKYTLSSETQANIQIDSLFDGIDFYSYITREKFEELCADLFRQTLDTVESSLRVAKMKKEDIHEIILVGGSSRIPKFQEVLSQRFSGKILNKSLHPDESAACGAAIRAAICSKDGDRILSKTLLLDVVVFSYGIETVEEKFHRIIPRCSSVPVKSSRTVTTSFDNQLKLVFRVYEGSRTNDNFLGKFEFDDIPPAPAGIPKIEVIFDVDAGNNPTVYAKDELTGRKVYANFNFYEIENCENENDKIWRPVVVEN